MENNYLLKHRQQQREREIYGYPDFGTSTFNRYDYYSRNGRMDEYLSARSLLPPSRKLTAIPPRLTRVRSEELLGTRSEPDLRPLTIADDDDDCRLFVALYDYDPSMSSNPNAIQEELSFRRSQVIKVCRLFELIFKYLFTFRYMVIKIKMDFIVDKSVEDMD